MQTYCIILAAGNSKRFSKNEDKLFSKLYGNPLIFFTLNNILKVFKKKDLFIVINRLYDMSGNNNSLVQNTQVVKLTYLFQI